MKNSNLKRSKSERGVTFSLSVAPFGESIDCKMIGDHGDIVNTIASAAYGSEDIFRVLSDALYSVLKQRHKEEFADSLPQN